LDPTNRRILEELGRDCRISYKKLAGRIGLSTTAVIKRVSSLIEDGTIMKFMVLPSQAMIGSSGFVALVHTDGTENEKELVNLIGSNRGVVQVSELVSASGRSYFVTGQFIGSERLQEFGKFLRGLDSAKAVELHTATRMLVPRGEEIELTKHQLLVLRALRKDARMQVKDIADDSGLSVKRVRKVLREIRESGAFRFTGRVSLSMSRPLDLVLRIRIDENAMSNQELWDWLKKEFPMKVLDVFQSATEPIVFAWFEPEDIREAFGICERVRQMSTIDSATPLVVFSHEKFPWLGEILLDEIIQEIE
jgi:DNA-binding Lrp family transcriptional regulator